VGLITPGPQLDRVEKIACRVNLGQKFLALVHNGQKAIQNWIFRSFSSLSTAQPQRGRQSTAQRAQRAEFIERSETVDGRHSGGYVRRQVFHW
jgi:hypothetical protein